MLRNYIRADLYRAFTSWQVLAAVVGITGCFMLGSVGMYGGSDICQKYYLTFFQSVGTMIYIFGAVACSGYLIEDGEQHFWYHVIGRGGFRRYTISKVFTCMLISILTMVAGVLLFVAIMSTKYPLLNDNGPAKLMLMYSIFSCFVNQKWILLYFVGAATVEGMLSGLLALASMYLSLFVKNRLFVISAPVIFYYFLENTLRDLVVDSDYIELYTIFDSTCSLFDYRWMHLLYILAITLVGSALLGYGIHQKIRREVRCSRFEFKNTGLS